MRDNEKGNPFMIFTGSFRRASGSTPDRPAPTSIVDNSVTRNSNKFKNGNFLTQY